MSKNILDIPEDFKTAKREQQHHLFIALRIAQKFEDVHDTLSPIAHEFLTKLTEFYNITTAPATNTHELDDVKRELASLKLMIRNLAVTAPPA